MKTFFNICLLTGIFLTSNLSAQDNPINNVNPPSPTPSNLVKFAEVPLNGYTGMANVNIPLYTAHSGSLNLSVSLEYSSNGVKINEIPGWVGEGFNLLAGGVITRSIQQVPDEVGSVGFFANAKEVYNNITAVTSVYLTPNPYYGYTPDLEPDMFYFNFCGYTGKFFARNKIFHPGPVDGDLDYDFCIIPHQNFKISMDVSSEKIYKITLIDDRGIQYIFGSEENFPASIEYAGSNGFWPIVFYLTSVTSPEGDVITLLYKNKDASSTPYTNENKYRNQYYESSQSIQNSPVESKTVFDIYFDIALPFWEEIFLFDMTTPAPSHSSFTDEIITTSIPKSYLTEIKTMNETLSFETEDHAQNSTQRLKRIVINNRNGAYQKEYDFIYKSNNYRLMLSEVTEKSNNTSLKPYTFDYYNYGKLNEAQTSYHIDHWGFYNGPSKNTTNSLIPPAVINSTGIFVDMSIREPEPSVSNYDMLQTITYPTGGTTEFVYESNRFKMYGAPTDKYLKPVSLSPAGTEKYAGGVRVLQIKYTDPVMNSTKTINYSYGDGILYMKPIYYRIGVIVPPDLSIASYYQANRNSVMPLGSPFISYTSVKETYSDGGSKVTTYSTMADFNDFFRDYSITGFFGWEVAISDCSDKRGKVKTETYSQPDKTVKFIEYNYGEFPTDNVYAMKIMHPINDSHFSSADYESAYIMDATFRYLKEKKITNYVLGQPKSVDSVNYIYNNNKQLAQTSQVQSDGSTVIERFLYPADLAVNCYDLATADKNTCLGSLSSHCNYTDATQQAICQVNYITGCQTLYQTTLATCDKYFGASPIGVMIDKNMISNVIEKQNLLTKNSTTYLTGGELNIYKVMNNGTTEIAEKKSLDVSAPITDLTQYHWDESSTRFLYNVNYNTGWYYDAYDNYGNILQYHRDNDVKNSFIWGYNHSYPIAKVQNANYYEIAFTSYEQDADFSDVKQQRCKTDSHTGNYCIKITAGSFNVTHNFVKSALHGKYKYSAWIKTSGTGGNLIIKDLDDGNPWIVRTIPNTNNQWKYFEVVADLDIVDFNNCTTVRAEFLNSGSSTIYLDDERFMPVDAQMTTYTYDPRVGITSETDDNFQAKFYKYDDFDRLIMILDQNKNVLKSFTYHYQNQ